MAGASATGVVGLAVPLVHRVHARFMLGGVDVFGTADGPSESLVEGNLVYSPNHPRVRSRGSQRVQYSTFGSFHINGGIQVAVPRDIWRGVGRLSRHRKCVSHRTIGQVTGAYESGHGLAERA